MADFNALHSTAARQFGLVTIAQLNAAGFTKGKISYQVQKGALRRRHGGVLAMAGSPPCWEQDLAAAALATMPLGAASHRSAARLWQFRTVDEEIEVVIPYPKRLILPDAIVHRSVDLVPSDITRFEGIPVTTPERTLCDLGLIFPEPEVLRILRHAVATGLVTRRDVWLIRKRISKSGRDGAGVIGRCLEQLPHLAEYTESGLEVMLLEICEQYALPIPSIQLPVIVGGRRFRLDFAYPDRLLFIEVDGKPSHELPEQIANDGGRQNALVAAGWQPLRFMYEQLKNQPAECAENIRTALAF